MSKAKITGFLGVFEDRLDSLISKIKEEYKKPKAERNKVALKSLAKEAKNLRKLVNELQEDASTKCQCPNCGHTFKVRMK